MIKSEPTPVTKVNLWKILPPILIGVGVTVYLIWTNFNPAALQSIHLSPGLFFWLALSILTIILRDGSFMYKIRLTTGNHLTWKKTFQTVMMWEFGACVFPKISEAAFVLFVLKQSGLSYGTSSTVLMLNAFFDNLSYVILFVIFYVLLGLQMLVLSEQCIDLEGHVFLLGIRLVAQQAWIGFVLILTTCIVLGFALFVYPKGTKNFFYHLGNLNILTRFKHGLHKTGHDLMMTSNHFKNQSSSFWIKLSLSTLINWISRFLLAFTILSAFSSAGLNFIDVFSRQLILWVFTSVPTTPGSSGVAEVSFMALNCEFMPIGLAAAIALLWRIFSYYLYLIAGVLLLPKWAQQISQDR